jgi:hypothetical protein
MDQFVKQDTCVVDVVQVPGSDQENLVPLGIVETSQTPALEASGRATPGVGFPFADQKNVRRVVAACPRAVVVEPVVENGHQCLEVSDVVPSRCGIEANGHLGKG